jgi:hypothetical protein
MQNINIKKREIQIMSHGTGGNSTMTGGDPGLARNPLSTTVPFPQTEFNASRYIDAAIWLNDTVGIDNWYAANATFYFRHKTDAALFKLRYM